MADERPNVVVTCGANTQVLEEVEGVRVGELRSRLADVMNIPTPAQAIIGGQTVSDDYLLQPGDQLEFVKPAGVKGW